MTKQTHREPTLYIVGDEERAEEIRNILEDEWGGNSEDTYSYECPSNVYFVNAFGIVCCSTLDNIYFKKAVANGWMKEYKLPEKPQFQPFDKVVVKTNGNTWFPALFGYRDENEYWLQGYGWVDIDKSIILPYNEQTAKLIGTYDEWKGGEE